MIPSALIRGDWAAGGADGRGRAPMMLFEDERSGQKLMNTGGH